MASTEILSQLSGPAAVRVSSAVQQVLADLQAGLDWVRATESPEVVAAVERAVAEITAATRLSLGSPLFDAHPQLKPAGWDPAAAAAGTALAPSLSLGDEDDPKTDENPALQA